MSSDGVKIGTWNVEYARTAEANARRRAVMDACSADIWILTETHDDLTPGAEYASAHSRQRPFYGSRVAQGSRWVSIWSRYPIITRVCLPCADLERTVAALIQTPIGALLVYGTVMPWKGDTGRCGERKFAAGWSEHHRVIPHQVKEWEALYTMMPDAALIVAGDFNSDMQAGAGGRGTKRGIEQITRGLEKVGLYCATASVFVEGGYLAHPPIDHIAVPLAWRKRVHLAGAWEGCVGQPRLSDHSGMVISIAPEA